MEKIEQLQQMIDRSENTVFLRSAYPPKAFQDFRSVDGAVPPGYDYPPETIISHSFLWLIRRSFNKFL